MTVEHIRYVKRTIWISECPGCGDRDERVEKTAKERMCMTCREWVPFKKVSFTGPDLEPAP